MYGGAADQTAPCEAGAYYPDGRLLDPVREMRETEVMRMRLAVRSLRWLIFFFFFFFFLYFFSWTSGPRWGSAHMTAAAPGPSDAPRRLLEVIACNRPPRLHRDGARRPRPRPRLREAAPLNSNRCPRATCTRRCTALLTYGEGPALARAASGPPGAHRARRAAAQGLRARAGPGGGAGARRRGLRHSMTHATRGLGDSFAPPLRRLEPLLRDRAGPVDGVHVRGVSRR